MTFADCRLQTADCRPQTADCRPQTADRRLQTADCRLQTAYCYLRDTNCKIIHIENIRIKMTSSSIKQRPKKIGNQPWPGALGYEVDFSRVKLQQPRSQVVFGCKVSEEMASTDSRYDSFFFFLKGYLCMVITSSRLIIVY